MSKMIKRIWLYLTFIGICLLIYKKLISIDTACICYILLGIQESLLNIEDKNE
jgi:hypothetical protein